MLLIPVIFILGPITAVLVVIFLREARRRHLRSGLWAAATVLAIFCVALLLASVHAFNMAHYWDGWDLNARPDPSEVAGTWRYEDRTVEVHPDGTYRSSTGSQGRWLLREYDGKLVAGEDAWHVLSRNGELVLLPDSPGHQDPDEWNKYAVWTRSTPP